MEKGVVQKRNKSLVTRLKRYWPVYLLALPAILYILINNYGPMVGMVVAFKNYRFDKGIFGSDWVGLKNFKFLFRSTDAFLITRNTILYNLAFMVLGTIFSIILAIFLNEIKNKRMRQTYQTIVLLPHLLSMVIISYLVYGFLSPGDGLLNQVMRGLNRPEISWYNQPGYWPFILVFVHLLCTTGYLCIVYLSTLVGIDQSLYEAASIDGATTWEKIKHITLPGLKPTIITMTLLALGKVMYSDFGLFYQVPMNSGLLYDVTSTIDTYIYRGLMESPNMAMSSAAAFYQSFVGFILVFTANFVVARIDKDSALF